MCASAVSFKQLSFEVHLKALLFRDGLHESMAHCILCPPFFLKSLNMNKRICLILYPESSSCVFHERSLEVKHFVTH